MKGPALPFFARVVEKLFAIASKVELLKRDKQSLGTYARYCYDLFHLSRRKEIGAILCSDEYAAAKSRASATHIFRRVTSLSLAYVSRSLMRSFFPPAKLAAIIGPQYETQC